MKPVRLHVFANGAAIFEFDAGTTDRETDYLRQAFEKARGTMVVMGYEIAVIEHPLVPLVLGPGQRDGLDQG